MNLAFSADSSAIFLGLAVDRELVKIFVGLLRNVVGLMELNFTSHGANEM